MCLIPSFLYSSKFGTKASFEKEVKEDRETPSNNDSETDDETDDEGGDGISAPSSSQFAGAPLRSQNRDQIIKILEKNGSIVLSALSVRNGSAAVQIGNALFKVTRVPLELCLSRIQAKEKKEVDELGRKIGANVTTNFDCNTITYLVSPDQASTAKSISAWAIDVPTVTVDFLRAFATRTKLDDPLPKYEDYEAPRNDSKIENNLTPSKRRRILGSYKVLSLMSSEGETMCRCTGAAIIPLYKIGEDGKDDLKFWQNEEFFEDLKKLQEDDSLMIVWLDPISKKLKKGKDYLMKVMKALNKKKDGFSISCVNQSGLAHAISDGSHLKDLDGNELVPIKRVESTPDRNSDSKDSSLDDQMETEVIVEESGQQASTSQQRKADTQSPNVSIGDENEETEPVSKRSLKISDRNQSQSGWITSSNSKSSIQEGVSKNSKSDKKDDNADMENIENEKHFQPIKKKITLLQKKNGWLCAAPQGKARAHYKRSRTELGEMGDAFLRESAETIFCSNLIVARNNKKDQIDVTTPFSHVKNFKKFQKNSIIAGAKMHSIAPITLVSVLPKESERQKELETMQSDLDREQRAADSLFCGNDGRKGRGGIRDHFGLAQASRGRRRKT